MSNPFPHQCSTLRNADVVVVVVVGDCIAYLGTGEAYFNLFQRNSHLDENRRLGAA